MKLADHSKPQVFFDNINYTPFVYMNESLSRTQSFSVDDPPDPSTPNSISLSSFDAASTMSDFSQSSPKRGIYPNAPLKVDVYGMISRNAIQSLQYSILQQPPDHTTFSWNAWSDMDTMELLNASIAAPVLKVPQSHNKASARIRDLRIIRVGHLQRRGISLRSSRGLSFISLD